ncbi:MAG: hypothetical protein N2319_09855 [Candidatus Kapabacteria bacterium]|nr:hypothetical protein [Candidatus Kapabacteria bacterium]
MKSNFFEKIFSLQADERMPVILLLLYSFFMGAAIAVFYTSTTSLILNRFDSSVLPYAYIVGGFIVYLLSEINRIIQSKFKTSYVLLINIGFLLVSTAFFVILNLITGNKWIIFFLFVWVRVFTFIHGVSFWAIAVKIFDLRQAKRLFGLISSGEVLAAIISQFSIPLLLGFLKTDDLLLFGLIEIIISLIFIWIIRTKLRLKLDEKIEKRSTQEDTYQEESFKKNKFKIFFENRYNTYIFFLALLPMFGMYFADYIFFTQSRAVFTDKEVLTQFLGIFFGFSAVLELMIKTFLTGRLVSKYGMKIGLLALPTMLFLGFGLPSVIGTVAVEGILFFSFITAGRLFMRIVRVGINDPVFQILYQPIDKKIRTKFQNQVEGQPKALGNILAGIVLIILTSLSFINILHITYFYLAVIIIWLQIAIRMYNEYRKKIREEITVNNSNKYRQIKSNQNDLKPTINDSTLSLDKSKLELEKNIEWLDSFLKIEPAYYDLLFYRLLSAAKKSEKIIILRYIIDAKLPLVFTINKLITEEKDTEIINYYSKTLKFLKSQTELDIHTLEEMSKSIDENLIFECVRWVGFSKRYKSFQILDKLMNHSDERIAKAAIIGAGISKRKELIRKIIDNLFNKKFAFSSFAGIKLLKNKFSSEIGFHHQSKNFNNEQINNQFSNNLLFDNFNINSNETLSFFESNGTLEAKDIELLISKWSGIKEMKKIIRVLGIIGGKNSIKFLREKINYNDFEVRCLIIEELVKLGYKCSSTESGIIQDLIENELKYILWLIACKKDLDIDITNIKEYSDSVNEFKSNLNNLLESLDNDIFSKKEAIFNLLSLLYNPRTIRIAKERIEEGGNEEKAFGIEMLEMTLNETLKELLISFFDIGINDELLEKYSHRFPQSELNLVDRIEDIILKNFNEISKWTKATAIECVEFLNTTEWEKINQCIKGLIFSKDRVISEAALLCVYKFDYEYYISQTNLVFAKKNSDGVPIDLFREICYDIELINKKKKSRISEIVRKLDNLELFNNLEERYRLYFIENSELLFLNKENEVISLRYNFGNSLYIVVKGTIRVEYNLNSIMDNAFSTEKKVYILKDNDIIFNSNYFQSFEAGSRFFADEYSEIIRIDYDYLSEFNIFWNKENFFEKIALKFLNQRLNRIFVNQEIYDKTISSN